MPRRRTPILASNTTLRRSARIQAKEQTPPLDTTTPAACELPMGRTAKQVASRRRKASVLEGKPIGRTAQKRSTDRPEPVHMIPRNLNTQQPILEDAVSRSGRKRKPVQMDENEMPVLKKHSSPDNAVEQEQPTKQVKRGVRFADGEDPEPLSKIVSRQDAANAVSVEYLASQAAQSNAPECDIREVRVVSTLPPIFGLAYRYDAYSLYRHLRARGQDCGGDQDATLAAFRARMASELGLVDGSGFGETVEQGRLAYTFLMSCSDRPETLPYPRSRIERFQELLGISDLPRVIPVRRPDEPE
ncbi:hypothetical protein GGG16DRAFT_115530 [Schizophyllum commune]